MCPLTPAQRSALTSVLAPLAGALIFGAPASAQAPPGLKAVWEPVNYGADIRFEDVFFITPEIGYVAGYAGTILKTVDSGASWTAQLGGDPASQERPIESLFFVSPTVGWATQRASSSGRHLYRTTDGEIWETVANIAEHLEDLAFASESNGVYVDDSQIWRTVDGGRTWSEVYRCATSAEVSGLTRRIECNLWNVHFATPTVAYALGTAKGDVTAALVVKSVDGGATWNVTALLEGHDGTEGGLFFVDDNTGYLSTRDARSSFRTTDGGTTWAGMPATAIHRRIAFADPDVGWTMRYNALSYTVDGGRRWASRTFAFPANPSAFSLPRRDVGYVVGEHGMIYRYRVLPNDVPIAANAIPAVAMPPLANAVIERLGELELGLRSVEEALAAPRDAADTSQQGELGWVEANFTDFDELETTMDTVATGLPELGRRHRNLNLLLEGLRLLGDLTGKGGAIRSIFTDLRQAKDPAAVSAALLGLHAELEAAQASVAAFESIQTR